MLSAAENELLTRIGPGSRMGALMRRYWHVVAAADEMRERWTKRVRILGEDLVLFKDRSGRFGLIGEFCPHRRASMAYGIPTDDGIRCPYHGWKFDAAGHCLEQPNEPEGSTFKEKVATAGYPVQELGGLLFAYLGPRPAPLLPRYDGYVAQRAIRLMNYTTIQCNWLQIMENSLDPVHLEWLHGKLYEFVKEQRGEKTFFASKHVDIAFEEFDYGIYKRRLLEGQSRDSSDWRVGHPVIFPTTLAVGQAGGLWTQYAFQIRVPIDDTHTLHYWYASFVPPDDVEIPDYMLDRVHAFPFDIRDEHGEYKLDYLDAQDGLAWETPGPITDRTQERLGWTDRGIIALRKMYLRELAAVEAGRDPMGTVRDPAKNEIIAFPIESGRHQFQDGFEAFVRRTGWSAYPHLDELIEIVARRRPVEVG